MGVQTATLVARAQLHALPVQQVTIALTPSLDRLFAQLARSPEMRPMDNTNPAKFVLPTMNALL